MFISFAQQFEDVLLWRALKHVEKGFYIDIGAHDPEICSVSKAFYDHNWRGVHVEPMRKFANLLREHRPDEIVLEVAIAEQSGIITFYDIPDGLSTANPTIAEGHRNQGIVIQETIVPGIPLSDVLERYGDRDIHWLKIDVEGFEQEVLKGWRGSSVRPWIVVVESTLPNTQIETQGTWEVQLLERGYTPALFDGLNRYYVSEHHQELREALQYGPTVFDQFAFSPTVPHAFTALIWQELNQERDRAQQLEAAWHETKGQVEALHDQINQREQALQQTLAQAQDRVQELVQQLESQKEDATSQIETLQIQFAQREQAVGRERDRAHQEREHAQVLQSKLNEARQKTVALNKRANQARREANQLKQELTSVYSSLSWKFGAPLRISKRAAKKVLRLLGVLPTPNTQPPDAQQRQPKAKAQKGKANAQSDQPLPSAARQAISAGQSAEVSELTTELNQVSATTQQVYKRLMQARQGNQNPD